MMTKAEKAFYEKLCLKLNTCLSKGALHEWDMGRAIEILYETQLWQKVLDRSREAIYTSFSRFLRIEFNLKEKSVLRYRRVAGAFTRAQVKGWRVDHLHSLANVQNPLQRQRLYRMACKTGFYEVEKEIRKLPTSELRFPVREEQKPVREAWSLADIQHILDEYENAYIRVDVARGKYRVSLVQGRKIMNVGVNSRLTRAVGDLKTKLERQRHPRKRSA